MEDTPLEAGLGFACKLKSDVDFLGRQALEKQKSEGLRKRIACFTVDESVIALFLGFNLKLFLLAIDMDVSHSHGCCNFSD